MKIVFFGTPDFVVPVLDTLTKNFDVVGVVTAPDSRSGRKHVLTPTPVKKYAEEHDIPVFTELKISNFKLKIPPSDFFVVAAYGKIIPQAILNIPKYGAVNIHPSLLPKYRGPSPIQAAILGGDGKTGVTIIRMDAEVDHGPIYDREEVVMSGNETFESLAKELFKKAAGRLITLLPAIEDNRVEPQEQDHANATFTNHITKKDGYIDPENPPPFEEIERLIRAYYPWPGAWIRLQMANSEWRIVKLLPALFCHSERSEESISKTRNGGDSSAKPQNDKRICLQMEGKNPVSKKDFLNSYPELRDVIERLI